MTLETSRGDSTLTAEEHINNVSLDTVEEFKLDPESLEELTGAFKVTEKLRQLGSNESILIAIVGLHVGLKRVAAIRGIDLEGTSEEDPTE